MRAQLALVVPQGHVEKGWGWPGPLTLTHPQGPDTGCSLQSFQATAHQDPGQARHVPLHHGCPARSVRALWPALRVLGLALLFGSSGGHRCFQQLSGWTGT